MRRASRPRARTARRAAIATSTSRSSTTSAPKWLIPRAAASITAPPRDPVQDDRRAPHVLEPAAPVEQAGEEQQPADGQADGHLPRLEAAHQRLVRELRLGLADELEQRLAREQAERRVDGDPGRGEEPDVAALAGSAGSAAAPPRGRGRAPAGSGSASLGDAVAVDEERDEIDERVREERIGPSAWNSEPADDEARHQPGERRRLEAGDRLAPQQLVAGGGEGDEAEDRRDGGRRRGALEQAGEPDDRQAHRERGDDHGDRAERRGR